MSMFVLSSFLSACCVDSEPRFVQQFFLFKGMLHLSKSDKMKNFYSPLPACCAFTFPSVNLALMKPNLMKIHWTWWNDRVYVAAVDTGLLFLNVFTKKEERDAFCETTAFFFLQFWGLYLTVVKVL